MAEFTLYSFSESGNAYKAALMLALCKADWVPHRVAFFSGETRTPEFRKINVMGEVPVLVHHRKDGDFKVTQSGAILTYLSKHLHKFGPQTEAEEYDVLRWLLFDSQKVSGQVGPLRFLRHFMKKGETPEVQFLHARSVSALKILDAALADRPWLTGKRPTIADLACQGYLHWPTEIGVSYDELPNLVAWLGRIKQLPGFRFAQDLMPSGQEQTTATA
jgi:glutathione S-transferase